MSLTTLPPELLSCVVAEIESRPNLCSLARCSRQFYLCTIPHLYHHVRVQEDIRDQEQQNPQLRNLASLLIRRPDLAGLVRCLTLDDSSNRTGDPSGSEYSEEVEEPEDSECAEEFKESDDSEYSEELEKLNESEEHSPKTFAVDQAFKTAIKALSLSEEEEKTWLRKISHTHKCRTDLILALLLPTLLKVEELSLVSMNALHTPYLGRVLQRAVRRERPFDIQPAFKALRIFDDLHGHETYSEWNTGFIASLLKLPAIWFISGGFGNESDDNVGENKDLKEIESNSSPLTSLDLVDFALSTADLRHILRVPKALEEFSFLSAEINFIDIRHALGPQEKCLKYLGFDHHHDYYRNFYSPGIIESIVPGPMSSFISFNTLAVFRTPAIFLQTTINGIDRHRLLNIFPPNLKWLQVTRCHICLGSLLEAVDHLLATKSPQQIPSLKKITLEEYWSWAPLSTEQHETAMGSFSKVAAARGISIEIK